MEKRKDIFPGYFINRPYYPSVKNLRRLLSEQDSCFHTSQVSMNFLEEHIRTHHLDNSSFIAGLCDRYSISGGQRNWEVTKKLMSRSFIVQTYNMQEIFFKDFNAEYRKYKKITEWKTTYREGSSTKSLDPYAQLIENIPAKQSGKFKDTPESTAIQYYRMIRNGIVHASETSMDRPAEFFPQKMTPLLAHFKQYYKFLVNDTAPAPNPPDSLNHYDFILYSRCLKNLSYLINDSCGVSIPEIFEAELSNEQFIHGMNRYDPTISDGTRERLQQELSNSYRTKYGNAREDIEAFIVAFINWRTTKK